MFRNVGLVVAVMIGLCCGTARATQMQVYGAWHCSNDACVWGTVRSMTDFDTANHWMIDRHSFCKPGGAQFRQSPEATESNQRFANPKRRSHWDERCSS